MERDLPVGTRTFSKPSKHFVPTGSALSPTLFPCKLWACANAIHAQDKAYTNIYINTLKQILNRHDPYVRIGDFNIYATDPTNTIELDAHTRIHNINIYVQNL